MTNGCRLILDHLLSDLLEEVHQVGGHNGRGYVSNAWSGVGLLTRDPKFKGSNLAAAGECKRCKMIKHFKQETSICFMSAENTNYIERILIDQFALSIIFRHLSLRPQIFYGPMMLLTFFCTDAKNSAP